jgi:hypothetical protein
VLRVARGGRTFAEPAPTDANGVTELLLPPGTYELSCWRRDVQPAAARAAVERSAPVPEQLPQARLPIGSIELPPGERVERELRLPDGWSR